MDWRFEAKVRTSGATAGTVDRKHRKTASAAKLTETTLVMQKTASAAKMVTPMHQVKRSAEENVERPGLLLGNWKFETEVCTSVTTGGTVDRPSVTPESIKRRVTRKQRRSVLSTSILRILQRACPGFRWILLQIRGNLLLMAAWFLKAKKKNGMLSSQAYRS